MSDHPKLSWGLVAFSADPSLTPSKKLIISKNYNESALIMPLLVRQWPFFTFSNITGQIKYCRPKICPGIGKNLRVSSGKETAV